MRFIQGRRVREIADRLAMSESDLYRKQRVAIGHLARVLGEMEAEQIAHARITNGASGAAAQSRQVEAERQRVDAANGS